MIATVLIACGVVPFLVVGLAGWWWHVRQMHAAYVAEWRRHKAFGRSLDYTLVPAGFHGRDHSDAVPSPDLAAAIKRAAERRRSEPV